jgi:heat-inducible transcriptional repressor
MLSYRARKILLLAVGDYIATGEPVASRGLAERHGVDLSPASVRAVLAELEAAGYLRKPHTSAGRVPTEEGLRLFAEAMVHLSDRTTARDEELARRLSEVALGLDVVLRNASKVLAEMTGSAALLRPPRADAWVLRDLRFLLLRPRELLAVIVSSTGGVEHRVLRVEHTPSPAELDRVNNLLRARIEGRTLSEVRAALAQDLAAERARAAVAPRPPSLAVRALEIGEAAPVGRVDGCRRRARGGRRPAHRAARVCQRRPRPRPRAHPRRPRDAPVPCSTARRRARGCAWSSAATAPARASAPSSRS